jgi:hypothetical protein
MILKDQKFAISEYNEMWVNPVPHRQQRWIERCDVQRQKAREIRDQNTHISLQQNIMEHIWRKHQEHEQENKYL